MNPYIRTFLKYFLQGVLIIGPLSTTIWIIWSIFYSVDNLIPHISERFPGLVFAIIVVGTTIIGYLGSRFLAGKLLVEGLNYILEHTPGVKFIYKTIREVIGSFVGDKQKFSTPVWVRVQENPEIWRIGFLTQEDMSFASLSQMVSVYLPHSYAISGWVIVIQKENIKPAEGFSAKQAMEFAVSGGTVGMKNEK
ncbi:MULTISPECIES: DUF502 domain-containing protein [unclassified Capnocytophaga]|jgi:Uncharacterized conserved protein|uniref:DUF502 domain-containing protein n=1 Tax=unclassified Capnocytophaga TaxID=2640652 RepID=UPI000202E4B3|nr:MULTISPECIES: DUF502 domain-containing protein [unclassified Capnocytophaga]EGD34838.1 hypothetical protein HMPREF9071_0530 [Capnocytophaga sp. oral taxon 338 str. F0234]MEB3004576.1 DUF502 domain-containing protein [Capnocytophaga sp. G2]